MNDIAGQGSNTAGKAAWICLAIAWVCFLVPIPGIGLFIGWPLNLVAFILAIVAMSKRGAMAGLIPLIASLIASPIVYFIGLAIFGATMGGLGGLTKTEREITTEQHSGAQPSDQPEEKNESNPQAPPEVIEVTSDALFAAYQENEISADSLYKGKLLKITAKISGIDSDFSNKAVVKLETENAFMPVGANGIPNDIAAQLKKGQRVTMICKGAGEVISIPQLNDCELQ